MISKIMPNAIIGSIGLLSVVLAGIWLCQRVGFISEGRLIALDSPDQLRQTQMRGQVLEANCSDPTGAVSALRAMGAFEEVALYGALIHAVAPDAEALKPQIERVFEESGVRLQSMDVIAPSLEDVFISSVRGTRDQPAAKHHPD